MHNPMMLQQLQQLQNQITSLQRAFTSPAQQVQQMPMPTNSQQDHAVPAQDLNTQQLMLLKMYDEFANTDDGKALAANLMKFGRFVQSKIDKRE